MKLLIIAANGQIAQIVEKRILTETEFKNVQLTLVLRDKDRLSNLATNSRVTLLEGDLGNQDSLREAMKNQDIVYVAVADISVDNLWTKNVISAMQKTNVKRVIFSNGLGIYNEVNGPFGRWNRAQFRDASVTMLKSDQLLEQSGLEYTTIRLPWLTNKPEIKYVITHRNDPYFGIAGSRRSAADLILTMVKDPSLHVKDSLGLADPDTEGQEHT